MTNLRFGEREWVCLWRVQGRPDVSKLGKEIAKKIDMEIISSTLDTFPSEKNGKGGVGLQVYWAWTESFLVISTWPELGFFRVYLASCKKFDPREVTMILSEIGYILAFEPTEI